MKPDEESNVASLPSAVAVIGMAGRFPGARNLDEFRRNLEAGVESITVFSDSDLIQEGIDPKLLSDPCYVKAAPLLEDVDQFDASFFEYSPREASIMDPQQRLFLECAWEALEDASHAGDAYGSLTGVFSGAGGIMSTYLLSDTHFNPLLTGTTASLQHVGNDKDYLSTRVSYKLNLRGPSLTVQTACSTSLVAVHLACQSLLTGECDMALAGGTTVRIPQRAGYLFKEGNVFSRDGHCRAFDAGAQGTVFGSGIGVVVLKRLKDALRDRDTVRAVIRGTAVNNDGSENKTSYWAPHADGQANAMRRALAIARVDPSTIGYVEAHGTATRKGDPTEVLALTQAFGSIPQGHCAIGSVKSNIGHPESAAGIAGLIKTVLSLEHRTLFPSLHYVRPNPEIDFGNRGFYVNTVRQPWGERSHPRRAGVNSLGIGGTNAFVILEEAPAGSEAASTSHRPCHVLTLSAKSPEALDELTQRFRTCLEGRSQDSLADICYSANAGRAHFACRRALVAASTEEAVQRIAGGQVYSGDGRNGRRARIAFLFTGQGSQYVHMGRELYETDRTFREVFDRCAQGLSSYLEQPLVDVLYPRASDRSPIDETAYTQPALLAIELSLAALWRSWGVEPSVIVGHSVGEIVAACVSGVMSLDAALRLTAARGRLMQALPRDGGMAAVRCTAGHAANAIAPYRDTVSIAAINSPRDVVISGRLEHVEEVVTRLKREGIEATRLKVSHAFHSPLMDPLLEEFRQVAASLAFSSPTLPLISNVTGELATDDLATPDYWVRHVRESVRFGDGIAAARAHGADVFVEVGPSPVLLGLARQTAAHESETYLPSLRPGRSDWQQVTESVAALYARGVDIDWTAFDRDSSRQRVRLPTYPFQRQRYWMDAPAEAAFSTPSSQRSLLGHRLRLPNSSEIRFETQWSPHGPPYLDDHQIFETVVVPGASHIAMVLSAMREVDRQGACVLEDVVFPQALTLSSTSVRTAQLLLTTDKGRPSSFEVMSLREGEDENEPGSWVVHAIGKIGRTEASPGSRALPHSFSLSDWQTRCTRHTPGTTFYDNFWEAGYHLRGAFRWLSDAWGGDGEILCELHWPDLPDAVADYVLYPALIDACFQCVFSDAARELLTDDTVYVPFSLRRFVFHRSPRPGTRLWCHVGLSQPDRTPGSSVDADITLCDETGRVVASIEGCQLRAVRRDALIQTHRSDLSDALYEVEWCAEPRGAMRVPAEVPERGAWIVFADSGSSISAGLIERIRAQEHGCIQIHAGSTYRRVGPDEFEVNGAGPDDVARVLREALDDGSRQCRGIIHLWSLDMASMADASGSLLRERVGASVLHLVQALARIEWSAKPPRLWLVTRGAQPAGSRSTPLAVQQAPLWGLGRVIALEHPELSCVRVDLDPADGTENAQHLFEAVWAPDDHDQLAYRQGTRYVPRLVRSAVREDTGDGRDSSGQPVEVRLSSYGKLDNLVVRPLTRRAVQPGEVEIQVRSAGLNFRDVLNALGLLREHYARNLGITSAADLTFGFECAGTVLAVGEDVSDIAVGDDVIAVANHDALASFVTLRREFVVPKPAAMTFEEAATLPLAFMTAYYGLHRLARLQPGERVLIHTAAGGVGQACLQWARHVGAEVFATASPAKWEFLKSIGVGHVMSSRTLAFAAAIKEITGGEGVDVVVNMLSGQFVDESFNVLKQGGRFIELGKRDVWSEDEVRRRRPDVSFFPFDLVEVSKDDPNAIAAMLGEMTACLDAGTLAPLPHTVFPVSKVADAFRFMAEAKHIGKVVIAMPTLAGREVGPPGRVRQDASYLITGGLGALGLEIANWLVEQGARHVVLTGRRTPEGEAASAVDRMRQLGAQVHVVQADVSDSTQLGRLIAEFGNGLPPLRGVVHAAGVLDDGALLQQSWERFRTVMAPKVEGTWNLHASTEHLPLDFFVCFSSAASLIGNAGQANYAAANAFMDALVNDRRARGLTGLSINWGPWADVGMAVAGGGHRQRRLIDQGFRLIDRHQGVQAFSRLVRSGGAQVGVLPLSWSEYLRVNTAGRPFFRNVAPQEIKPQQHEPDIRRQLADAADPRVVVTRHVRSVVGRVLGMRDPDGIDPRARLFDLGLESLMAVEMKGRFEESLGCSLRPTLVFDYPTIEALTDHLVGKLSERSATPASAATSGVGHREMSGDELANLNEDEIADRLLQELTKVQGQ